VEGVAYGVRACLEAGGGFEGCGSGADGILRIVGGGAQSPLVCEIMASVLGRPLQLGPQASVGVTGAAVSGLAAIGIEEGMLRSRHSSSNREDVIYRPRGVEQDKYDSLYNERFTID
jgi:sugar (pentulose or hexulose) kinase